MERHNVRPLGITLGPGDIITPEIRSRPLLAALLGVIVAEWSAAESVMAFMFGVLLQIDMPASTEILDFITNQRQKRDMLMRIAMRKIKSKALLERLKKALHELQDAGDKRTKAVHGRWGTCPRWPNHLVWQRNTTSPMSEAELWGADDFTSLIREIAERRSTVQQMIADIARDLGVLPAESPPQPGN